jgi:hypothetical protein
MIRVRRPGDRLGRGGSEPEACPDPPAGPGPADTVGPVRVESPADLLNFKLPVNAVAVTLTAAGAEVGHSESLS